MEREAARQEVRRNWRSLITMLTTEAKSRVNGETSYICPLCKHGTNGDGLTFNPKSRDGNGLKCFSCNFRGDIIDLYMELSNIDHNTAFLSLAEYMGITVDPYKPTTENITREAAGGRTSADKNNAGTETRSTAESRSEGAQRAVEAQKDYTAYYQECRERLTDPAAASYLTGRGISLDTARAYWIGYDPKADPAGAGHTAPRIIIPTSTGHYIGRAINPNTPKAYQKMNVKGSSPAIFNQRVLFKTEVQEAFITEGAFDALSIIEAGAAAIALNSTANAEKLISVLEQQRTEATLILCLDTDEAGQKATETIITGLKRLNIAYIKADICGSYKDPNERLQKDREDFFEAVQAAKGLTAPKPDNVQAYIDTLMGSEIKAFKSNAQTGFDNLDKLSGGLYPGLYTLAAATSLGKTTFCHQIADQIAAAGTDVIYFSLEQSRLEMVTKSLARITAQKDLKTAVTSLSIRKGYMPPQVVEAAQEYKQSVGDRMNIVEGNFSCNLSFIGDYVRRYIARNDVKPVVVIDYLQILQSEDQSGRQQTTKEVVDTTVTAMKRLSREQGLAIIAICSVNRANYLTPVDFESLKESGNIEYTADVVWGLQLHCLSDPMFEKESGTVKKRELIQAEKVKSPRSIDLVCLKNRYGPSSYKCSFEYYPVNDLFVPVSDFDDNDTPKKTGRRL